MLEKVFEAVWNTALVFDFFFRTRSKNSNGILRLNNSATPSWNLNQKSMLSVSTSPRHWTCSCQPFHMSTLTHFVQFHTFNYYVGIADADALLAKCIPHTLRRLVFDLFVRCNSTGRLSIRPYGLHTYVCGVYYAGLPDITWGCKATINIMSPVWFEWRTVRCRQ